MLLKRVSCAILVFACFLTHATAEAGRVGTEAPAPVLRDLEGKYTFLSHLYYSGEERPRRPKSVVILYFTALHCAPCRTLLPELLGVIRPVLARSQEAGVSVRFFMVSTDPLEARQELIAYLKDQSIDAASEALLDPYRTAAKQFGVSGIPHTIVISPGGKIAADIIGAVEDFRSLLIDGIRTALRPNDAQ